MRATYERAADKRRLIRVMFERQTPDASAPVIEAVYEVKYPEDNFICDDTAVLIPLSVTRTDTKETVVLTDEERDDCHQAATEKAAAMANEG
jgi:hypothetical protein